MSLLALLLASWRGGGIARWAEIAAAAAFVFFVGFAFGQYAATSDAVKSVVETVQTHADREFASATAEIAANVKAANARIQIETEKSARAADLASATLRAREASAHRDRDAALAQLSKERKELHDEMDQMRVAVAEPRACGWSGDSRRVLDQASGADPGADFVPGDRAAEADPAGRIAAAAATASASAAGAGDGEFLTCNQLFRGYVNLSEWARGVAGQLEAAQQWMRERLLEAAGRD